MMQSKATLTAFVIMPFVEQFVAVFESLIPSALSQYNVVRADSDLDQENILRKITAGIRDADLIVADVTGTNANVMYELGAAHALNKPTVIMSQRLDDLPFDLRSYPVLAYETAGERAQIFVRRLREIGERHAAGQLRFTNPFADFPAATLAITPLQASEAAVATDEYDLLDYQADMETYGQQLQTQFAILREANVALTAGVTTLRPEIEDARKRHSAVDERRLLNSMAALMQDYASSVESEILPLFHQGWQKVADALYWMASIKPEGADVEDFCSSGRGLREALRDILSNVATLIDVVKIGKGRTGTLNKSVVVMTQALNSIVSEVLLADALLGGVYVRLGCEDT
jgi:hypothetical protein